MSLAVMYDMQQTAMTSIGLQHKDTSQNTLW